MEEKKEKEEKEKAYTQMVRDRMTQLQEEVNTGTEEFIKVAKNLKKKTAKRSKYLKKLKKKYTSL